MTKSNAPARVALGQISGVFGFRGEVRVLLHHPESPTLRQERSVFLLGPDGQERSVCMQVRKGAGRRILGRIAGVDTEEAARTLMGWKIEIERQNLPPVQEGEYYVQDLLGLPVIEPDGKVIGFLEEVVAGVQDIWIVAPEVGDPLFLLATPENIQKVDLQAGQIHVAAGAAE